jgi:hypothetical protein
MLTYRRAFGGAVAAMALAGIASMPAVAQSDRAPAGEAAQRAAPRFEQRVYDLATLLAPVWDHPGPTIDLRHPVAKTEEAVGETPRFEKSDSPFLPFTHKLIDWIKTSIAEESWGDQRTSIEIEDEDLVVIQTPEVHAKIAQWIASWRRTMQIQVVVDGTLALVEDALLDACRAGAVNPAALTESGAKALAEAIEKGERAKRVQSLRVVARNGQRIASQALRRHRYIGDYDAEATAGAVAMIPQINQLVLGAVLEVLPSCSRGRLTCQVCFTHQESPVPIPSFATGSALMGPLGLPEATLTRVETTVSGQDGQTLLAGRVAVADPAAPRGVPARSLCFFIRPTRVPANDLQPPPSDAKRQMRFFDIDILSARRRDFPGAYFKAHPDTSSVTVEGEPDIHEIVAPETLIQSIRRAVAPETWENDRRTIGAEGRRLYAVQAPDVLDAIGRHLDEIAARRWRVVMTRADLLAADEAEYRAMRGTHPQLDSGAVRLERAEAEALLARAATGAGLTRAASGEVAGMNRQRVHIAHTVHASYVRNYTVSGASLAAVHDPQVDVAVEGLIVDCRPILGRNRETVHAQLRVDFVRLDRPIETRRVNEQGLLFHVPSLSIARVCQASLVAPAGEPMLVGLGGPVRLGGGEKHLLAIVRLTPVME